MAKKNNSLIILGVFLLLVVVVVVAMFFQRYKEGFISYGTTSPSTSIDQTSYTLVSCYNSGYKLGSVSQSIGSTTKGTGVTSATISLTGTPTFEASTGKISFTAQATMSTNTSTSYPKTAYYYAYAVATFTLKAYKTVGTGTSVCTTKTETVTLYSKLTVPYSGSISVSVYK